MILPPLQSSDASSPTRSQARPYTTPPRPWWRQLALVLLLAAACFYSALDFGAQKRVPVILADTATYGPQITYDRLRNVFPMDRQIRLIAEAYRENYNRFVLNRQ